MFYLFVCKCVCVLFFFVVCAFVCVFVCLLTCLAFDYLICICIYRYICLNAVIDVLSFMSTKVLRIVSMPSCI